MTFVEFKECKVHEYIPRFNGNVPDKQAWGNLLICTDWPIRGMDRLYFNSVNTFECFEKARNTVKLSIIQESNEYVHNPRTSIDYSNNDVASKVSLWPESLRRAQS